MKINRFSCLATVVLGLATLSSARGAEKEKSPAAPTPVVTANAAVPADLDVTATQWNEIKDVAYDNRAAFFTGLQRLEARVDDQIKELTGRRAAMTSINYTKDWDFAMKEMGNARTYLKSTGEVLRKATPETWQQEKDKVGQAWVRVQDAYKKVKTSTTR